MDIERLDINAVCLGILCNFTPVCGEDRAEEAAGLVRTLQSENEKLRGRNTKLEDMIRSQRNGLQELRAELEQVTQERDAVKSPEVLEAVDELMEFARARMSTGNWLYYVEVLGEWRGQKED